MKLQLYIREKTWLNVEIWYISNINVVNYGNKYLVFLRVRVWKR